MEFLNVRSFDSPSFFELHIAEDLNRLLLPLYKQFIGQKEGFYWLLKLTIDTVYLATAQGNLTESYYGIQRRNQQQRNPQQRSQRTNLN